MINGGTFYAVYFVNTTDNFLPSLFMFLAVDRHIYIFYLCRVKTAL